MHLHHYLDATFKVGIDQSSPPTRAAWETLQNGLNDCEITVNALAKLLEKINPKADVSGGLKKFIKQIKLNMIIDEINAIKPRIQTHTSSLHMSLQLVVLSV